jgi:hypothetical protein
LCVLNDNTKQYFYQNMFNRLQKWFHFVYKSPFHFKLYCIFDDVKPLTLCKDPNKTSLVRNAHTDDLNNRSQSRSILRPKEGK